MSDAGRLEFKFEDVVERLLTMAGATVRPEEAVGAQLVDFMVDLRGEMFAVEAMAGRLFPQRLMRVVKMLADLPPTAARLILVTEAQLSPGLQRWLLEAVGGKAKLETKTLEEFAAYLKLSIERLDDPRVLEALRRADRPMRGVAGPAMATAVAAMGESVRRAAAGVDIGELRRRSLGRLLSSEAIDRLGDLVAPDFEQRLKIGERVPRVVVLLSDIVNFSTFVKHAPADLLNDAMNSYYNAARKIIWKHNGALDKFIGDAVLAMFGYPDADPDAARNAVRAARDLIAEGNAIIADLMVNINDVIDSGTRVGIAKGDVFVMNLSLDGIEPTFTGDVINRAARFEKNAKVNHALIDRMTYNALQLEEDGAVPDGTGFSRWMISPTDAKGQSLDQWGWFVDFGIAPPLHEEIAEVRSFIAREQAAKLGKQVPRRTADGRTGRRREDDAKAGPSKTGASPAPSPDAKPPRSGGTQRPKGG